MKRLVLASLVFVLAMGATLAGGCRRSKPEVTIPHVQQESAPKKLKKGPDTVVPADLSLEQYVEKYYQAYKEKRWEEAYNMQSAGRKAQETLEGYISSHSSMPLTDFKVLPASEIDNTAQVSAELNLSGMSGGRPWVTTWSFTKKDGKWIVEGTKSGMKR